MLLYIHLKLFCLQHQHASDMAHRLSEMSFAIELIIAESLSSQFSLLGHTVHHMNKFFAQLFIHERAKT